MVFGGSSGTVVDSVVCTHKEAFFLSQEYVFYSKVKQNIAIGYPHQDFL